MSQSRASQFCSCLAGPVRPLAAISPPPELSPFKGEGGMEDATLEKTRFLKRAFDDRLGVDVQPILQHGGV
jgi:hypothetical protein